MYKMKADGVVFYDPSSNDMSLQVLSPKAKFELNKADTLEFTMLPGNVAYDSLQKMKTIITLEDDGEVIFRGRVLGTTTDLYNQKEVYCESELGYLFDSLVRPYEFYGKASDLFRRLVAEHNAQVDSYKHFKVGIITAVTDEDETKTESEAYTSTYAELRQMLVTKYGGYLRVRTSGGVRYLDYIDEYNEGDSAPINFGENLVDIEEKYEAGDVFSVLVPLGGYNTKHKDAITIAEVNGGLDYIESPSAVAKYGRIVKTYKWEELTDPQEILEKGQEQLTKMEEERTLVIKAYDLHGLGQGNRIRLGSSVYLGSSPHGLNGKEICSKLELDIESPDQSEYTFGIPPETLTDNNASRVKKTEEDMDKLREWFTVTDEELTIAKQHVSEFGDTVSNVLLEMDAINANILLKADQTVVTDLVTRVSSAEILIDGLNSEIKLVATQKSIDEMVERLSAAEIEIDGLDAKIKLFATESSIEELVARVSAAEIAIDGANAQINLKASQSTVNALGERVASAELLIDGQNSKIAAKADLILLDGYVKMEDFEAVQGWATDFAGVTVSASSVIAGYGDFDELACGQLWASTLYSDGETVATESHSHKVTVNSDGTITLGEVSSTGGSFRIADTTYYKNGVSAAREDGYDEGYEVGYNEAKPTGLSVRTSTYNSNTKTYSADVEVITPDESGKHFYITIGASTAYNVGYNSGYDEGFILGESSGYNIGYAQARPASVSRTAGYDAGNNVYNVSVAVTSNDGTTRTYALEAISAREATNAAYNSGYDVGYRQGAASIDTAAYYNEGYAAGFKAAKDAVKVTAGISWSNPAQYYAMVRYWGRATIDGEEVGYASSSEARNISGYC